MKSWWRIAGCTTESPHYPYIHWLKFHLQCENGIENPNTLDKIHFLKYAVISIMKGNTENLREILQCGRKEILNNEIEMLLQCAIDTKMHECYVMLLNYKYENNLFRPPELEL